MTVGKVQIEPHDKGVGWYRMTITSIRDAIGETKIELLISEETLRWMRYEINKVTPAATSEDEPAWLKAFRDMDK